MAKTKKAKEINDFDLDLETLDSVDSIEPTIKQSTTSVDFGDFNEFLEGLVDIDEESEEFIKALFYGPNGTGKTTVAGTFPKPLLVLDVNERGTRVLAKQEGCSKRNVDVFEMFAQAYWYLKSGKHPYKTVVIDNVTTLQEVAMRYVMNKEATFDLSKDMDMPTKRDWGGLSQLLKRWLIDFRNLDMNVVFIAQEKRDKEEDLESDEASVYPQVTPSVKSILGAAVDVIGRTYVLERTDPNTDKSVIRFCMRIAPSSKYLAKIRIPEGAKTPNSVVNPSYDALYKIMSGEYKPKNKKEDK